MTPTSHETLQDQPKDPALNMEHLVVPLSTQEVTSVLDALGNPETDHIKDLHDAVEASIPVADKARQTFLANMEGKTFASAIGCRKAGNAAIAKLIDTWQAAQELSLYTRNLFSTRITALNNEYRALKKKYDVLKNKQAPGALPTRDMKTLSQQWEKVKALKEAYEALQPQVNTTLSNFSKMMENKVDQHKAILYGKKYKGERLFDKEKEKDAETKAKKGTQRDPENATKYLGGGPVHQKGKCAVTDVKIKEDKATMREALSTVKHTGPDRTGIVKWSPDKQTVPVVDADVDQLVTKMNTLIQEIPDLQVMLNQAQGIK